MFLIYTVGHKDSNTNLDHQSTQRNCFHPDAASSSQTNSVIHKRAECKWPIPYFVGHLKICDRPWPWSGH
jgi:hypothetical protein